jgi:quercetin dioxygenase-like cupin family protein
MKYLWIATALSLGASLAHAEPGKSVIVTPVLTTDVTASGQAIVLPSKDAQLIVSTYEIAPGAALPAHRHPYPRFGYMLAGSLRVTNLETGKSDDYKAGDFIPEAIGQWHQGANTGDGPVKILVIDQVERGRLNVEVKH